MGRVFSAMERRALFNMSGGVCSACGALLPKHWHADHIMPFSHGGKTDVVNGQALCPKCNLEKSDKMEGGMIETVVGKPFDTFGLKLRRFQDAFVKDYFIKDKEKYLLNAIPGSGKTLASLVVAANLKKKGVVKKIAVVTYTAHLCEQWIAAAKFLGLKLQAADSSLGGMYYKGISDGFVATYSMMGYNRYEMRKATSAEPFILIADEVHHCGEGDKLSWGDAIGVAFEPAKRILSLSGTPFRTDGRPIPLLEYELVDGQFSCRSDFQYSYQDGRDDGIIRWIHTHAINGRSQWIADGQEYEHDFEDELTQDRSRERKNTIIPRRHDDSVDEYISEWGKQGLIAAIKQRELIAMDPQKSNAAGLVVTVNTQAADAVGEFIQKHDSGIAPTVVHYKRDESSDNIKSFRDGLNHWIVSSKMISEGVDIPRLAVGVYLTNVTSELYFQQYLGRISRVIDEWGDGRYQDCHNFMPKIPEFQKLIDQIGQDNEYSIRAETEGIDIEAKAGSTTSKVFTGFTPLGTTFGKETVFADNEEVSIVEVKYWRVMQKNGVNVSMDQVRKIMNDLNIGIEVPFMNSRSDESATVNFDWSEQEDDLGVLKAKRDRLVRILGVRINGCHGSITPETLSKLGVSGGAFQLIGRALGKRFGYIKSEDLTMEGLESSIEKLSEWGQRVRSEPDSVIAEILRMARG